MGRKTIFSEDEEKLLVEEYKLGATIGQLKTKYHCCHDTVQSILKKQGISGNKKRRSPAWAEPGLTTIRDLAIQYCKNHNITSKDNVDYIALSQELNCSVSYVKAELKTWFKSNEKRPTMDDMYITQRNLDDFKKTVRVGDIFMVPKTLYPNSWTIKRQVVPAAVQQIFPNLVVTDAGSVRWSDLYQYKRCEDVKAEAV